MLPTLSLAAGLLAVIFAPSALAIDKTRDPALVAQLKAAATQLDRLALLPNDEDWLFDFTVRSLSLDLSGTWV